MKRGYTALEYKSTSASCARARPDIRSLRISSSAFPGETDADFEQTMRLVDDVGFDGAFSFTYSPRPGTPAAESRRRDAPESKQARLARLQAMLDAQYRNYRRGDGRHACSACS